MMRIQAIVRGDATRTLKDQLAKAGVEHWRSWEVHDFGSSEGLHTSYRGREFTEEFARDIAIDVIVSNEDVDRIVDMLVAAVGATGTGEGEILVYPIARSICIAGGTVQDRRPQNSNSGVPNRKVA
jgi:nitrogen regulatory protein P-II 1